MKLDHVGWVTWNLDTFEAFWVKILGFKKIFESNIPDVMNQTLFGCEGAYCARYKKDDVTIEVHAFNVRVPREYQPFRKHGINHIALWVKSREKFLKKYNFTTHIYHNPKGWDNIFIQDFEGNWIELRTDL